MVVNCYTRLSLNSTGPFSALHPRDILARMSRGCYEGKTACVEFKLNGHYKTGQLHVMRAVAAMMHADQYMFTTT